MKEKSRWFLSLANLSQKFHVMHSFISLLISLYNFIWFHVFKGFKSMSI